LTREKEIKFRKVSERNKAVCEDFTAIVKGREKVREKQSWGGAAYMIVLKELLVSYYLPD
jgi:hypothetical protein